MVFVFDVEIEKYLVQGKKENEKGNEGFGVRVLVLSFSGSRLDD